MRLGSGILGWALIAVGAFALGVVGFNLVGGDGGEAGPAAEPAAAEVQTQPSDFAREALPGRLLDLYRETGEELGLDWSVIAAIDQIEGRTGPAEEDERVAAIGYSLEALGAPEDYRLATEAHGGSPRFARTALRLADRYREVGDGRVPRASGKLRMPTRGPVIASFGRRLGILHDGIDIDAPTGRPIRAASDGLVISTGTHSVFGQYTCVLHRFAPPLNGERRVTTCYGNQSRYATEPGARVEKGEVIGYVGCTGTCLRPGLHFQVRLGSGPSAPVTDPAPFLADPGRIGRGAPLETPARPPE
jgi:murein DD-endopeptidase MepM/ murein hydrolase activator NlpD